MQLLKTLLKRFTKLLGVVVGLAFVLYLIAVVVNWNDVPPSELALQFEESLENQPVVADEENLAVALRNLFESPDEEFPWRPELSEFAIALSDDCRRGSDDYCLDLVVEQQYGAEHWLDEHQWVLDRYIKLLGYSVYQAKIPKTTEEIPSFGDVAYGHKLLMKSAMLSAINGDKPHVIALLEADLKFWRLVLANSEILITKMIAAAYVRNHFLQGNKILRVLHESHRQHTLPLAWLDEISPSERSLRRPLIGEWRFISNYYDSFALYTPEPHYLFENRLEHLKSIAKSTALVPLFQPQESKNTLAADMRWYIDFQDVPLSDVSMTIAEAKLAPPDETYPTPSGMSFLTPPNVSKPFSRIYNATGDYLFTPLRFDISWITRTADLEGVRRAAVVTTLMREQQIEPEDVAGFLEESEYRNPYSDDPFDWDANAQDVTFDGLREDRYDVYKIQY